MLTLILNTFGKFKTPSKFILSFIISIGERINELWFFRDALDFVFYSHELKLFINRLVFV